MITFSNGINNRGSIYAANIGISQDTAFIDFNFSETTRSSQTLEVPLLI
jgi:hypothetical protein